MVYTANDLLEWKDFPKGLRVLLLDENDNSAVEIRSKLEGMDYIVSTFSDANKALSAISSESESFHVAIVEAETIKSQGNFKFLETAKDLPTIMTSNTQCLNTMMKCIALGAVAFLLKPLCEDKLRNIWQHAVHKAFNAGQNVNGKSLKPVKESLASMIQLEIEDEEPQSQSLEEMKNASHSHDNDHEHSSGLDKYPAPSTPQLKQGARLLDEVDCLDQTNSSTDKESSGDQEGESKSVETTCCNVTADVSFKAMNPPKSGGTLIKEEKDLADVSNSEPSTCLQPKNMEGVTDCSGDARKQTKGSNPPNPFGARVSRKKMKVDWTPDLHKKFVQAVEQLGVDQAVPSRILELMKVEGLTRHNVASHLQKFRMHRRHILPKEDDQRSSHSRGHMQRGYSQHRPIVAYPPYHSNQTFPASQSYPVWGQPGSHLLGAQVWRPPGYHHTWQPAETWPWSPYPVVHADAWGCPVMPPPPQGSCSFPQNASTYHHTNAEDNSYCMPGDVFGLHPAEEVIDMVVKEAISKPWLPLPLGLKPPSTESVLSQLSRQGMSDFPSHLPPPN